mmetsp:Transcript_10669/g.22930  ORF Transcript_10669/g.22930 Transcript_10669/m.22930 type:complete len:422 (+) Transcript_10669:247-1512(+)
MEEGFSEPAGLRNGPVMGKLSSPKSSLPKLRVGCALLPKKVARYLTPSVKAIAKEAGMELCLIDYNRPLSEQGPFNAIIHKLRPNKDWERNLLEYSKAHPEVRVIDRVDGIRTLQNRATMLSPLHGDGICVQPSRTDSAPGIPVRVQAPVQVEIHEGTAVAEVHQLLADAGLRPPLLVKPLWTDGREGSHGLAVVHDMPSLEKLLQGSVSTELKPPVVVQQFVEHGGVLHKVYVLGRTTVVCQRPSLGDNYLGREAWRTGVQQLPRISCQSAGTPMPSTPSSSSSGHPQGFLDSPPEWVTHKLASVLRKRLGLQLFNFDLICPEGQPSSKECLYYVIDINYFPGVDKIPRFEHLFVQFLHAACKEAQQQQEGHEQQQQQPAAAMPTQRQQQQQPVQLQQAPHIGLQHAKHANGMVEPAMVA